MASLLGVAKCYGQEETGKTNGQGRTLERQRFPRRKPCREELVREKG